MSEAAPSGRMADERFGKRFHLRRRRDFDAVYADRVRAQNGVLIVVIRGNGLGFSRLGLSVSRKVGKANIRNGWKRRIREAFRRHRALLPKGFDLIVIPQRGAGLPDGATILGALIHQSGVAAEKWRRRYPERREDG